MDWVEFAPPIKPDAIHGDRVWISNRVYLDTDSNQIYLLVEFLRSSDTFLEDYRTSRVIVQWETDAGIGMNTTLVEVLHCRKCTTPRPIVELWCKMTRLYACIRFDPGV